MLERCLKGITVQSSQLGGVLQPILKKPLSTAREADSRQTAIFLCKNLSRYPSFMDQNVHFCIPTRSVCMCLNGDPYIQVKGAI